MISVGAAITAAGLVWAVSRTHDVAEAGRLLDARPEMVLISPDGFPPREFGATWGKKRWLSTLGSDDLAGAVDVVRAAGVPTFAVVQIDPDRARPTFAGYHETGRSTTPFAGGFEFTVVSYARD
jgi:hypothetical protein